MPQGVSQSWCQTRTVAATVQEKRAEKRKCLLTSGCFEGRGASKHASLKVPNQDSCSNNMCMQAYMQAERRRGLLTSGCSANRDASKHASLKVPNQDSCSNNMIHAGRKEERCAHIWVF